MQPSMGSVLVFPHGGSGEAALHEGSEVVSGVKYVIRTEVLFPADTSIGVINPSRTNNVPARESRQGNNQ